MVSASVAPTTTAKVEGQDQSRCVGGEYQSAEPWCDLQRDVQCNVRSGVACAVRCDVQRGVRCGENWWCMPRMGRKPTKALTEHAGVKAFCCPFMRRGGGGTGLYIHMGEWAVP